MMKVKNKTCVDEKELKKSGAKTELPFWHKKILLRLSPFLFLKRLTLGKCHN